ncbi:hypothetical protein KNO15_09715 [Leifsonia shinshuensis]|uniref:hypothetical protein n=1 Tax=Leifsonia shinshuensis TaxID=150026 RepID=UPI001F506E43|nr:hypothetical protein [Leifsonia shinshuensis]MCI0156970.1 hypothetical protein [Leifsonia shinshuensis]
MSESHDLPRWMRWLFGLPRLWTGFAWLGLAGCVTVFGIAADDTASCVFAGMACLFGVIFIAIATHDKKYSVGRYRRLDGVKET